ncbi:hypothetical protein FBU59_006254 [Linderina macrospora]|uniref:Uncharacterized protein n=1 Tax=Linderina macrospora TaxID=4868 RepID=A0ACC1J0D5_9FUNG|nr:hypothetical protein FBU59_006254 [Linderina macrospora]
MAMFSKAAHPRLAAIEAKQIEMQVAITKAAQSGEGNDDCIEISQRMELSESLNMLIEMVAAEFDFYTVKEKDTAVALPPCEIEDGDQTEAESALCVSDLECIGIMPAAAPEQATVLERAAEPVPTHAEIAIEADDCASTCTKSADDSGWITVGPGGKPIKGGKAVRNKSIRKRRSKGKKTSKKTSKK